MNKKIRRALASAALAVMALGATLAEAAPALYTVNLEKSADGQPTAIKSRAHSVAFNRGQAIGLKPGSELEMFFPNGRKHTIVLELTTDHGDGIYSLVGHFKGRGNHNRMIVTSGPTGSFGKLETPEGTYRIVPGPDGDWMVDLKAEEQFLPPRSTKNDELVGPSGPQSKSFIEDPNAVMVPVPGYNTPAIGKAAPTPMAVVDIMFAYTRGLATALGANLMTRLHFLVQSANTSYVDSEVAITLRLVNATMVDYTDSSEDDEALYAASPGCAGGPGFCNSTPYNSATFGPIETVRNSVGADIVAVLRNGSAFGGSGIAWVGSTSPNASLMYSVTTGCTASCETVFIHEVGHNMGNRHDRATSAQQAGGGTAYATQGGAFTYSYGYAFCKSNALSCNPFVANGTAGSCGTLPECSTADPSNFSDIMAYFFSSTEEIAKFSNPAVMCTRPGGDGTARPCGILSTLSNSADTAKSMNDNRVAMANIKASVVGTPPGSLQFTSTSASVVEGVNASVSVSRVGGSVGAVSVSYSTASSSALSGADFTATTGTLNWANGDTSTRTINVPVIDDGVSEAAELFTISLSNATGPAGVFIGSPATVNVLIQGQQAWPPGNSLPAGWSSSSTASRPWSVTTSPTFEGTHALQSFNVVTGDPTQQTFLNSDLVLPPTQYAAGVVGLSYNVSTYPGVGFFEILVDGVVAFTDTHTDAAWKVAAVSVTAGVHAITFRFKNRLNFPCANAVGAPFPCNDRAYVDAVSLPLPTPLVTPVVSVTPSVNPSVVGQTVTFTAVVSGDSGTPAGSVHFRRNGTSVTGCTAVPLSAGSATCATNALTAGAHTISVQYGGSSVYSGATGNAPTQTVYAMGHASVIDERGNIDFNNDGIGDLSWKHTNGSQGIWLMNGLGYSAYTALSGGTGAVIRLFGDFNADGKSDVLWRRPDGSYHIALMDGLTPAPLVQVLGPGSGWEAVGKADLNADGKSDLLWKHATNGSYGAWLMDGTASTFTATLEPSYSGWQLMKTGDFTADGKDDLLWMHSDGRVRMQIMDGLAVSSTTQLIAAPNAWRPIRLADFNGDGKADIVYRHSNGQHGIWQMDGATMMAYSSLLPPNSGWELATAGDLNGDGKDDLVWSHTDGRQGGWLMDGVNYSSTAVMYPANTGWSVSGNDDYNGDGKADLIWRHTNGSYGIWLMDGLAYTSYAAMYPANTGWNISP